MNKDQMQGKLTQLKGSIKKTWGKLTDDEIALVDGQKDKFFGIIQEKHGDAREAAEKKLKQIEADCGCDSSSRAA